MGERIKMMEAEIAGLERIAEANRETVVALRDAAEKFARERNAYANDLTEALKLRDELRGQRDAMRLALLVAKEALGCWAAHDPGCPGRVEGDEYCACGLWSARVSVDDAIKAAKP